MLERSLIVNCKPNSYNRIKWSVSFFRYSPFQLKCEKKFETHSAVQFIKCVFWFESILITKLMCIFPRENPRDKNEFSARFISFFSTWVVVSVSESVCIRLSRLHNGSPKFLYTCPDNTVVVPRYNVRFWTL